MENVKYDGQREGRSTTRGEDGRRRSGTGSHRRRISLCGMEVSRIKAEAEMKEDRIWKRARLVGRPSKQDRLTCLLQDEN